jgi:membrane protein required for colicin V production
MLDIIIIVTFLAGAIVGFSKGLIKQLASLLGLVVGLFAARALYASLAVKLSPAIGASMSVAQILSFVLIWTVTPMVFMIFASVITKAMDIISIGWLNRYLGAGLGALKYMLLMGTLVGIIESVDAGNVLISKEKKEVSSLYYAMGDFAKIFMPLATKATQHYLNKNDQNQDQETNQETDQEQQQE